MPFHVKRSGSVVVIGAASLDVKARAAAPLVARTSNHGRVTLSPGGVARNVAENLARLGLPVSLITAVGDDAFGRDLLERTARAGVDVTPSLAAPEARTGTYAAILDHVGDMTVSIDDMEIVRAITPAVLRARADRMRGASLIVVDANLQPAVLRQALTMARRFGVPVCADPVSVDLARRLKSRLCDIAIITPNAAEAAVLCGQPVESVDEAAEAARRLTACGVGLVVITLAERGLFYASTEGSGHVPAPRVDVVDATGAGDALTAGVLCGLFQGLPVDECMRLGVAAATLTLQTAETVYPSLSLERLYESMGA